MREVKSVRVRKNYHSSLDMKVTLNEDGKDVVLFSLDNANNPVWLTTRFTKKGLFKALLIRLASLLNKALEDKKNINIITITPLIK